MANLRLSTFVTVCFVIFSNALPFFPDKRSIQADQLSTFKLMREFASAAYCPSNVDTSAGTRLACVAGNCPDVQAANTETVVEYDKTGQTSTDAAGFVAVDHTNSLIIVSFRGSVTIDSWITDYDSTFANTDICSGCTAHNGFWQSWLDSRDIVTPAVKSAAAKYPKYKINVVGHSLGGAVASLAAASLRNSGLSVALYNYGSPRIGGTQISSYITNQAGGNYRFTHIGDPVPKLPLLTSGYVHISPEYYINSPNGQDVSAGNIQTISGAVNLFKGNQAQTMPDYEAHKWYFGQAYFCDAKKMKRGKLSTRGIEEDVELFAAF